MSREESAPSTDDAGPPVHRLALVEPGARIGEGTRLRAFVHVLGGAVIGRYCELWDHVLVDDGVTLGDRVTVRSGVQLAAGTHVEDDVVIGSNATFADDLAPELPSRTGSRGTRVRSGASVGANATILRAVTIGVNALVEAGSVVTRDVPPHAVVSGSPARITGYVAARTETQRPAAAAVRAERRPRVRGVRLLELPYILDMRGSLSVAEVGGQLPFEPKRYFIVFEVPSAEVRGEHAHLRLQQFLVCVRGSCAVVADDGTEREEFLLDRPNLGLYVPPMVWATQYKYSADGVLLVLASDVYDASDYIRDYDSFLAAVART